MEKHQFTARDLRALIIPLIADSFLSILIGMADTIMVSGCGEAAVSGVSLVDTVSNLLITVFSAFATGGAVVVSQYLGHCENDRAKDSAKNLIYISIAISALMTAVILPLRGHIINLLFGSIDADVRRYTDEYFVPILISYPFLAVYSGLTAISRSERKSFRTMMVSIMMNVINIGGNAILIYIIGLGPRGAGIASLASRIAGCVVMASLMMNRNEALNIRGLLKGPVSPYLIKRILRIGIPSGLEGAAFHVGKIMVQSLVASLGTSAIAINVISFITILWIPEIVYKNRNAVKALFSAVKKCFNNFKELFILYIFMLCIIKLLSIINTLLLFIPILYFFVLIITYYFIVYFVVLLFTYYEQKFTNQ